jgi:hypothetical protein
MAMAVQIHQRRNINTEDQKKVVSGVAQRLMEMVVATPLLKSTNTGTGRSVFGVDQPA